MPKGAPQPVICGCFDRLVVGCHVQNHEAIDTFERNPGSTVYIYGYIHILPCPRSSLFQEIVPDQQYLIFPESLQRKDQSSKRSYGNFRALPTHWRTIFVHLLAAELEDEAQHGTTKCPTCDSKSQKASWQDTNVLKQIQFGKNPCFSALKFLLKFLVLLLEEPEQLLANSFETLQDKI